MKTTRFLLAFLLLALPLFGQTISGNITTSSTDCSIGAACISLPLPTSAGAVTIQATGTFTGTLQFEMTSDAKGCQAAATAFVNVQGSPLPSGAAVSSATAPGTWRANGAGGTCLRVRASAFASGTAAMVLNYGTGSASTGGSGGGGGFDLITGATNTSAAMVVGTGASLATSGSGTIAATSLAGLTGTLNQIPKGAGSGSEQDSIGLSESYPTFTVNESQTTNGTQAVIGDVTTTQLTAPTVLLAIQGASSGGFLLHNQAYFYKVTAISANGETTVSNESTFTTGALPAPDTYTATLTWTGHTGDTGYKVYRSTGSGTELLLATVTPGNVNNYTDNTNTTPSGAMPASNTTGKVIPALPIALANGGTANTTAAGARGSTGLNVEGATGHGDSIYSIVGTDRFVYTNAAFTVSRTWTLPAANAVNVGGTICVADLQGTVTSTNTLVIARAGADTINGGTSATLTTAFDNMCLVSDGTSKWYANTATAQVPGGGTGLTVGTSGGVPYFNTTTTMASSAALTLNKMVKGGGAGAAPAASSVTDDGTTLSIGANFTFDIGNGLISKSGNITTAGQGVAVVQCVTAPKTETGADTAVLSCTPAAAVGIYEVCVMIDVSAANTATLGWTMTWTNSKGNANAPTNMSLFQMGVAAPALTFTAAANNSYYSCVPIAVNNAGTAIVVKTTFTGTSIAYNVTATIKRIA